MNMFENIISEMSEEKLNDLILRSMSVDEKKEKVLKMFIAEAVHVAAIEDERLVNSWQEGVVSEEKMPSNRKWHFDWSNEEKLKFDDLMNYIIENESRYASYEVRADIRDQVMFDIFLKGTVETHDAIAEFRRRMIEDWPTGTHHSPASREQVPTRYFYRWANNINLRSFL